MRRLCEEQGAMIRIEMVSAKVYTTEIEDAKLLYTSVNPE